MPITSVTMKAGSFSQFAQGSLIELAPKGRASKIEVLPSGALKVLGLPSDDSTPMELLASWDSCRGTEDPPPKGLNSSAGTVIEDTDPPPKATKGK